MLDDIFDVEVSEKAEKSLDAFIEKRSKELEAANKEQRMVEEWNRRERARIARRQEKNRREWIELYGHQHRYYLEAAQRAADRRSRLLLEAGHEPDEGPDGEAA